MAGKRAGDGVRPRDSDRRGWACWRAKDTGNDATVTTRVSWGEPRRAGRRGWRLLPAHAAVTFTPWWPLAAQPVSIPEYLRVRCHCVKSTGCGAPRGGPRSPAAPHTGRVCRRRGGGPRGRRDGRPAGRPPPPRPAAATHPQPPRGCPPSPPASGQRAAARRRAEERGRRAGGGVAATAHGRRPPGANREKQDQA